MAKAKKRKLKSRLSKKQHKQLKGARLPLIAGLVGLVIGITAIQLWRRTNQPANIVWAADNTVKVPRDLQAFLLNTENNCKSYRGAGSPDGVCLWGVYQMSQGRYAKIAYGCSWSLSSYIMAVKPAGDWQLLPPAEYFAPFKGGLDSTAGALPFCTSVEQYKIPGDIEPFCVQPDGSAKANEL